MMKNTPFSLMTFMLEIDVMLKKLTIKECLLLAKNEGIPYVDVMDPSPKRVAEYSKAIEETGVKTACYICKVSFFSNDETKIKEVLAAGLRNAAALGAKLFMIVPVDPMKDEKICGKLGKETVRERLKKYFSLAIRLAEDTGIKVCFETTPQDYTSLSGIADCRWILEQVSELGLVYDTANMLPYGDDPLEYYEALKKYIVHVHVKDVALSKMTWVERLRHAEHSKDGQTMLCCVSGQGVIPLKEILRRMERDGYKGTYALEYSHPYKFPANFTVNAQHLKKHMDYLK